MDEQPEIDRVTAAALRARRGDAAAATAFVRATQADVWRLCRHLGSAQTADDLTQETYARAFAALHRFVGRSSARTWLLSIARRSAIDAVRSAARRRRLARLVASRTEPESGLVSLGDGVLTEQALACLDPDRRTAFVLTQLLGFDYAGAAEVCGCPVGTIRSRVARAREQLIAAMQVEPQRRA
jgi:RNA polymerase sigma-70 factor (ECF subfamily)